MWMRGFQPYDEGSADAFHGRTEEIARLVRMCSGEARVVALSGPCGVGKTSLLRAGLVPALGRKGVVAVVIGAYDDVDDEVLRATSPLGLKPPGPSSSSGEYLARIARESSNGMILILDHVEEALADEMGLGVDLGGLLARVLDGGGNRLRVVLSVDEASFSRLDQLREAGGLAVGAGAWMTLPRLSAGQCAEILERSAVQSGTFFESGLAAAVAEDLCRDGPCRALDLQIAARAVVDLRLTSVRRYRRSGGAVVLPAAFLEAACTASGGAVARRALLAVA